ncbi:RNase adaptor protein RapZ [Limnohabitans sp. 2KL-1]|uniref:RNase adapter RapZ n=1 Tax=Limnohabitans sp. 2KL-1 TaxID=1100699 RepID=UPI000D356CA9|nr:RNase adapter RapZ [Limnohabitans sp. 2KL-1]PUE48088.1 RNase adaptor protein RapZ [Limnohabitans sp. 2KL-1]
MSMDIILITGMSGSGKSVALHALEDAGYYCVDNLPPELLIPFVKLEEQQKEQRLAIAIDVRSANSLHLMPEQMALLGNMGMSVKSVFLDASSETLQRRYSETRRKHPLSGGSKPQSDKALFETIEFERELLADLRESAHVIDTSLLRSAQLQTYIKSLVNAPLAQQLTLVFESFAFKRGIPTDADYVFDVRMLPNPHYESALRPLTGRDEPVQAYLRQSEEFVQMQLQIEGFLKHWIQAIERDHRSYVTVAIGCTGGQHRSVFMVEQLAQNFSTRWLTLKRHRELDAV